VPAHLPERLSGDALLTLSFAVSDQEQHPAIVGGVQLQVVLRQKYRIPERRSTHRVSDGDTLLQDAGRSSSAPIPTAPTPRQHRLELSSGSG
jgi:hypothetical protein